MKYFVCADIHSFYTEWIEALSSKGFDIDNPEHKIIVCGDLFDRGHESVKCYDFMNKLLKQNRAVYIRGNHEDLLKNCYIHMFDHMFDYIDRHHYSNGTVGTICDFLRIHPYDLSMYQYRHEKEINQKIGRLVDWIDEYSVDYFELGNFIFVHGWIPTRLPNNFQEQETAHENWQDGDWKKARWDNGMEQWYFGFGIPDKTIVCGHWHTSWGHVHIEKEDCEEFSHEKDVIKKSFRPFIHPGIIALDACTAYSHFVNCIVISNESGEWELIE